jgi:gamma-glutamyltranspeptidase/glutathione hydrolase
MYRLKSLAGVAGLLLLAGCSLLGGGEKTDTKPAGLVVGDEPVAVRTGAALLAEGGSAADAAAAMYFALSVTYPVAAGIGGGGICIVHDPVRHQDEEVDFLPRDAAHGGAYAVPGSVSGFAFIQSSYGKLPWQRVVAAGEGLASAGFPISNALATRLADNVNVIRLDAGLAAEFLDESGNVKAEGSVVNNPSLAQTLSMIRTLGAPGFYQGAVADKLVAYSTSQGGAVSDADLRAYAPGHGDAMSLKVGDLAIALPSRHVGAGAFTSAMLSHLVDAQGNLTAGDNLGAAVASATKTTLDEFHLASLPRDLGASGFAATDASGQAVACAVTMNGPFGSGHTAASTGVTLARAPSSGDAGLAAAFLAPALARNDATIVLAGAGAGGPNGTAAIVYALLKLARGADVIAPGQLHSTGIEPYETVNVIACREDTCAAIPDPGAHGLGAAGGNGN